VKTWLLDDAFGTVDTWVPLVDMFGANAGVMHCQFSSGRPGRPATSSLTSVSLTVEKATLLVTPSDVLGMVRQQCFPVGKRSFESLLSVAL
jgi:hypothetical protein